jgi:ribose/xylose/arabinose/galactoside ABC-type transport system permease subunit
MLVILVAGIDISTGALVAFASVGGALAAVSGGAVMGIATTVVVAALAGTVSGLAVSIFQVQAVIATIGMLGAARGLALLISNGQPVGNLPSGFLDLANGYVVGIPAPVIIALVATVLVAAWLLFTPSGRALFAIGGSGDAARAAGINVRLHRTLAYAVAGGLAGLAAVIYTGRAASGQPTFGVGLEIETIAAVVLGGTALGGGRATVAGTAFGAIIVAVLSNGMELAGISPYIERVVLGFALIIIVFIDLTRRRILENIRNRQIAMAER